MASDNFARVLALAALDDSELKSLEERVDELARIGFKPLIVEELPTEGMNEHTLYLVPNTGEQENDYNEYLWFEDTGWELMGTTSVDLSNYVTLDGNETISGVKTFTALPQSDVIPSNDNELTNKKYIDDALQYRKVFYVDDNSADNPFVFSEHELGIYSFKPKNFTSDNFTSQSIYLKAVPNGNTLITYAWPNMLITYWKDAKTVSNGDIAYLFWTSRDSTTGHIADVIVHFRKNGNNLSEGQSEAMGINTVTLTANQTISSKKTFTVLPESSVVPTTNNQLTNKSYVDTAINAATIQYTTMPEATASTVGKVVQYTGETNPWYTNGYFYIGIENTGDPTTYDWIQLNVQPETKPNVYVLSTMNNTQQNPVILANCKPGIFVGGTDDHTMLYLKLFEEDPNTYGLDLYYGGENCFYYTTDLSQYDYETYTGTVEFGYTLLPVVSPEDGSKVTNGITRYIYYGGDHSVDSAVTKAQQEYVKTSGAQTINGVKTFTSLPESSATPENNNQLVNKLYTDTAVSSAIDDRFFHGTDLEWNELTQEQQDDFLLAVVYPAFVELTPEDQSNLSSITGSDEPVVSDMTEEDAIAATDEIIGGGNGE